MFPHKSTFGNVDFKVNISNVDRSTFLARPSVTQMSNDVHLLGVGLVRLVCLLVRSLPLSASRVTMKKKDIKINKTQSATAALSMPDNPPSQPTTKYWGKAEKASLTSLINTGNVHIFKSSLENIETIWREHFPHRESKNLLQQLPQLCRRVGARIRIHRSKARRRGGR
jgi:hypothetical protein